MVTVEDIHDGIMLDVMPSWDEEDYPPRQQVLVRILSPERSKTCVLFYKVSPEFVSVIRRDVGPGSIIVSKQGTLAWVSIASIPDSTKYRHSRIIHNIMARGQYPYAEYLGPLGGYSKQYVLDDLNKQLDAKVVPSYKMIDILFRLTSPL